MYQDNENAFKIHEFVAHSTEINCLSFGPKSHQVLATGGNDCKVNVWKVGDAANIWTLGQNKSPVSCLCFDAEEQYVVSGAMNGSIKVFDLNEGRLARNLSGHQVDASSIQYHPYGEFIVSGSIDCSMKVWDVRNKSCIQTYSGHKKEVTCVRFSPDGRWIASSSKDNQLLIWDLVAGKLLSTIRLDPAYVTSFEFNPAEFIIGAVTSNRNVRLWDLETMEPLGNTPSDSSPIRAMTFSSDGNLIYTGTKDSLKSFSWEPSTKLKNSVEMGWDKVSEIRISADGLRLTAGSFNSNFVAVWSVNIDKLSDAAGSKRAGPLSVQRSSRSKAVPTERLNSGSSRGSAKDSDNDVDYRADAKRTDAETYNVSHQMSSNVADEVAPAMQWASDEARNEMASTMSLSLQRRLEEAQKMSNDGDDSSDSKITNSTAREDSYCKLNVPSSVEAVRYNAPTQISSQSPPGQYSAADRHRQCARNISQLESQSNSHSPSSSSSDKDRKSSSDSPPPTSSIERRRGSTPVAARNIRTGSERSSTPVAPSRGRTPIKGPVRPGIPSDRRDVRDGPSYNDVDRESIDASNIKGLRGLRVQSNPSVVVETKFNKDDPSLRAAARRAAAAALAGINPASSAVHRRDEAPITRIYSNGGEREEPKRRMTRDDGDDMVSDMLDKVLQASGTTVATMSQRLSSINILLRLWTRGNFQDVIENMDTLMYGAVHDPSQLVLLANVFSSIELKGANFTLQSCVGFMKILDAMLSTSDGLKINAVVYAALKAFTELCVGFGDVIRSAGAAQLSSGGGVDLAKEERLKRCHACHGLVYKMKERLDRIKQVHRADYNLLEALDNLTPMLDRMLLF